MIATCNCTASASTSRSQPNTQLYFWKFVTYTLYVPAVSDRVVSDELRNFDVVIMFDIRVRLFKPNANEKVRCNKLSSWRSTRCCPPTPQSSLDIFF